MSTQTDLRKLAATIRKRLIEPWLAARRAAYYMGKD